MKKRVLTIAMAMMLTASASAQVFVLTENDNDRDGSETPEFHINNPDEHNSGQDYYAPVGSGALLLAGLAGAYLIGKKKEK